MPRSTASRLVWIAALWIPLFGLPALAEDDSRATTQPVATPAEPMAVLRPLIGNWRGEAKWSSGEPLRARVSYEWGVGEQVLKGKSFVLNPQGEARLVFETFIYHHPGDNSLRFISISVGGGLYEGTVAAGSDRELNFDWTSYLKDRSSEYRQTITFVSDDRYRWVVWQNSPEGWKKLIEAEYARDPAPAPAAAR